MLFPQSIHQNRMDGFCHQEKNALASLGSLGFTLLRILPLWLIHLLFLTSPPEKLTLHPYQILIHFNHHGNRFVCNLWTIFLFLSKTNVRRAVLREIFDQQLRFKEILGLN